MSSYISITLRKCALHAKTHTMNKTESVFKVLLDSNFGSVPPSLAATEVGKLSPLCVLDHIFPKRRISFVHIHVLYTMS